MKKQRIFAHVREHACTYIILIMVMLVGVVKGTIDLMKVTDVTVIRLSEYIRNSFNSNMCVDDIFFRECITVIKLLVVVWVCGASLIGIPVIAYIIYFKGYVLGFLSTVLIKTMGARGIGMIATIILPKEIFLIPMMIALSVIAIHFSLQILGNKRVIYNRSTAREFVHYTLVGVAYGILAVSVIAINVGLLSSVHCKKMIEIFAK